MKIFILSFIFLVSLSSNSNEITVAYHKDVLRISEKYKELYDLVDKKYKDLGLTPKFISIPSVRAINMIRNNKVDSVLGVTKVNGIKLQKNKVGKYIDLKIKEKIYFLGHQKKLLNFKTMEDLNSPEIKIVVLRGFEFLKFILPKAKYLEVNNISQFKGLLAANRADVAIVGGKGQKIIKSYFQTEGLESIVIPRFGYEIEIGHFQSLSGIEKTKELLKKRPF
jgi:hypothetical protein